MPHSEHTGYVPPFSIFNKLFLLSGIDLYLHSISESKRRKRLRCIRNIVLTALSWIIPIYVTYETVQHGFTFANQVHFLASASQVLINIHVILHLDEIKRFVIKLSTGLGDKKGRLFTCISFLWFIIAYAFYFAFSWQHGSIHRQLTSPQRFLFILYYIAIGIHMSSMPLQTFTLILLYFDQRRTLLLLYRAARKGRDDMLFDLSRRMIDMNDRFNKLFSLHPFMWLLYHFFLEIFILISVTTRPDDYSLLAYLLYQQVVITLALFLLIWVTQQINRHQGHLVFIFAISSDTGHREMSPSISCSLDDALACRFTVWTFFSINGEMLLSFISSVLTFAVLAIQFTNGCLKNQQKVVPTN